jgi:HEAT repeat protein
MNGFFVVLALAPVMPAQMQQKLPPALQDQSPTTAIGEALKKLAVPCPDRIHFNDIDTKEEGPRFIFRPRDLYDDCADEMDALVKTREQVDDRLLELGHKGKDLPERYRAAWILIQRRNEKVVPILAKMANSSSAEERYLAWDLYTWAINKRQLAAPQSFDATLDLCRKEKNRYVQQEIMRFLGDCKAKEAVPLLMDALEADPDNTAAVSALGKIGDPNTVPEILACAKKAYRNHDFYYSALGQLGTPEAVDYLIEHLDKGCSVIKGLFESGSSKALPAIEKYLEELKKKKKPDALDLAVAQISVLRLKYKDPREQLIALAEDLKQSQWMRTHALQALGQYDKKPYADRILKLYRTDTDDWVRMFYIRLLDDLPGKDITDAMIDQALTDNKDQYYHSHNDLLQALNQRLKKSFRSMPSLVEYLQRERAAQDK